jgi:predicted DCC family thiol-disulfide oxidoreductase YuxK
MVIKFAPKDLYQFVAFQSLFGQELLIHYGFPKQRLETVIIIDNNGVKTHSDGFIKIMS